MGQEHDTTIESRPSRQEGRCQAPAGVFERVGPGYQTSPAILAAMGVLRRDLEHSRESLEGVRAALVADGSDGCELLKLGLHLARTRAALVDEMRRHSEYLNSGEPERLAAEDK